MQHAFTQRPKLPNTAQRWVYAAFGVGCWNGSCRVGVRHQAMRAQRAVKKQALMIAFALGILALPAATRSQTELGLRAISYFPAQRAADSVDYYPRELLTLMGLPALDEVHLESGSREVRVWVQGARINFIHAMLRITLERTRIAGELTIWWSQLREPFQVDGDTDEFEEILDSNGGKSSCRWAQLGYKTRVRQHDGTFRDAEEWYAVCHFQAAHEEADWGSVLIRLDELGIATLSARVEPFSVNGNPAPCPIWVTGESLMGSEYHCFSQPGPGCAPESDASRTTAIVDLVQRFEGQLLRFLQRERSETRVSRPDA